MGCCAFLKARAMLVRGWLYIHGRGPSLVVNHLGSWRVRYSKGGASPVPSHLFSHFIPPYTYTHTPHPYSTGQRARGCRGRRRRQRHGVGVRVEARLVPSGPRHEGRAGERKARRRRSAERTLQVDLLQGQRGNAKVDVFISRRSTTVYLRAKRSHPISQTLWTTYHFISTSQFQTRA